MQLNSRFKVYTGALKRCSIDALSIDHKFLVPKNCRITSVMESFLPISTGHNCYTWEEVIAGTKTIMIHMMDSRSPGTANLKAGRFDDVVWNHRRGYNIVTVVESFFHLRALITLQSKQVTILSIDSLRSYVFCR